MGIKNLFFVFRILFLVVSSFILIHLFSVFGFFLAFAYPIWLFFMPETTGCFWCRVRRDGDWCPFCKKRIDKSSILPSSPRSIFLNVFLILIISGISLGIVFVESRALKHLGFPPTPKTVSFSIPSKGQYRLGEIFSMKIDITGIKSPINAVRADLSFDPKKLEVVEISTKDSFANIFIQKEIGNDVGFVRLSGGLPNPGFFGDHGIFGTVLFRAKEPGIVKVEFLPSSLVLANDAKGSSVLKDLNAASYLILPEELSAEEKEDQKIFYEQTVLGAQSEDKTQMTFYKDEEVLGSETKEEQAVTEGKKPWNPLETFLIFIGKIDQLILSSWTKIFGDKS